MICHYRNQEYIFCKLIVQLGNRKFEMIKLEKYKVRIIKIRNVLY